MDVRPLKELARSRLPNGNVFREYILALDDEVTKDEYLVVVKQSLRLMDSGRI